MPIQECTLPEGGKGYRWGESGKCFANRADAERQAAAAHANGFTGDRLALDRASMRRVDETSGHLHVTQTPISKSNVCPYFGREIPDFEALGLKPDQTYQLFRDPAELAKAAPTFNGKPLMIIHKPQVASDHDRAVVVGSVSNPNFDAPYLLADLAVWDGDAIKLIESDEQRELSCGYFYKAAMESGSFEGTNYDGRMVDIVGNHVTLVSEGRAGPDVFVGDAAPSSAIQPPIVLEPVMPKANVALSRKALLASGALRVYLKPKLAQDAKVDFRTILKGVTAKSFAADKAAIVIRLKAATEGKLAQDADLADVVQLLDALEGIDDGADPASGGTDPIVGDDDDDMSMDDDMMAKVKEILGPDADDAKCKALCALLKPTTAQDDLPEPGKDPVGGEKKPEITKAAMDAAIAAATKAAEASTIARLNAIHEAHAVVTASAAGKIAIACDSAEAVYRAGLDVLGIDVTGVHPSAYRAILSAQPKPGDAPAPRPAMDAAATADYANRFPDSNRLKH